MILLVSDYDQTLSMDDMTIKYNIKRIEKFRENGNLFMLSTGRTYSSIQSEIKKWRIPYDYLSCADGLSLYDSNDNLLYVIKLNHDDLGYCDLLKVKYKSKIDFFDVNSDNSEVPEERVIQIKDIHFKVIANDIQNYFKKYTTDTNCVSRYNSIYLRPKYISKSTAINYIANKLEIEKKDIFTIGDHDNDLEMIRDYNGFTMLWGSKIAKEYALKQYLIMSGLISDIENKNKSFVKKLRFK